MIDGATGRYLIPLDRFVALSGEVVTFSGERSASLAFVGMAPSPRDPGVPLSPATASARRLRELLAGAWPHEVAVCANLSEVPQNVYRRETPARRAALAELLTHPDPSIARTVVCLGDRAAEAMGAELYEIGRASWGWHVAVPHPSGKDRAYSEESTREQVRRWLAWARISRRK